MFRLMCTKIYCLGIEDMLLEIFKKKTLENHGCPLGNQTPNSGCP